MLECVEETVKDNGVRGGIRKLERDVGIGEK